MELNKNIKWSPTLEDYFVNIGERCYCYGYLHKKAEGVFSFRKNFISLPVIILSTIAGTLSIGGGSIFPTEYEQGGNIGIGMISLFVGILNTVESYFGWGKRTENHRLSSIQYNKLFRFISIELSLPINERMGCSDLLKFVRETYERLQEVAPLIPDFILADFKIKFSGEKYETIAKPPEANGLEPITVYHEDEKRDKLLVDKALNKFLKSRGSPNPSITVKIKGGKGEGVGEKEVGAAGASARSLEESETDSKVSVDL